MDETCNVMECYMDENASKMGETATHHHKKKMHIFVFNFRSLPKSTLAHSGVSALLELLMFSELCPKDDSVGLAPK